MRSRNKHHVSVCVVHRHRFVNVVLQQYDPEEQSEGLKKYLNVNYLTRKIRNGVACTDTTVDRL